MRALKPDFPQKRRLKSSFPQTQIPCEDFSQGIFNEQKKSAAKFFGSLKKVLPHKRKHLLLSVI